MAVETLLGLIAALGPRETRVTAAQTLAAHVGAAALFVFVPDTQPEGALVPAPGFSPTVPGGRGWRDLLQRARTPGHHAGVVRYPAGDATMAATACAFPGLVVVFVGGDPCDLDLLETAVPLLRGLLQAEHAAFVTQGELQVVREAASHATALAAMLDRTRADLERQAYRTAQLQQATARLATTLTPAEVSAVLLDVCASVLRAAAGVVYVVGDAHDDLRLTGSRGAAPASLADTLPIDGQFPLSAAVRARAPIWLESRAAILEEYPWIAASVTPAPLLQAMVAVPLVHGNHLLGGFGLSFDTERRFDADERSWLVGFASQCAVAVERARLVTEMERTVHFNQLFTGILGHDLRNPLGAILTAAQLVLRRSPDEKNIKPLTRIISSGERMTRMVDQLLDFTRARIGGGIPLEPRDINLRDLIEHIVDEQDLSSPGWTFDLRFDGDISGHWDPDRLSQVFSNLVTNAVRHGSPAEPLTITVDGAQYEAVTIALRNAGVIPPALLPVLFDPFRGTQHRRNGTEGLGLGLFITEQIVRAHGGSIRVASSEADGTCFTIALPRRA